MLRQLAIASGLLAVTLPLLFELKPAPALGLSLFPLLPWALPQRARQRALWLMLSLWGALAGSALVISLALWLFPSVTPDGHGVMPIGQVLLGGPLGALAGFVLLARLCPREPGDVTQLSRLCALAAVVLLGACVVRFV